MPDGDDGGGLIAFLGAVADPTLLDDAALADLPDVASYEPLPVSTRRHDTLVAAGSWMTGITLVGGGLLVAFAVVSLIGAGAGGLAVALGVIGLVLVATHWGWVHVAEYLGVGIDERQAGGVREHRRDWLARVEPYPRFAVTTRVLADASTRVERIRFAPVRTSSGTFTFARDVADTTTFDADAPAQEIAETAEAMRHRARVDTDRLHAQWDAAATTYRAALHHADDERERAAARHAAAVALSEHINASLREPPVVE